MNAGMHAVVQDVDVPHHDDATFLDVLDRCMDVLRGLDAPSLLIGEIGSSVFGRDRGTRDIDVLVRPEDAPRILERFGSAGFDTDVVFEHWLFKARRDAVDVDIIFRAARDILLDERMLERASSERFRGRTLPIAPPEDLVVMKVMAADEDTARYWYDALGILARSDLDWDYLCERAMQHGARRMLSLLLYATSIDLVVPPDPVHRLYEALYGGGGVDGS